MNVMLFILIVYIECCEKTSLMYVLYIVANKRVCVCVGGWGGGGGGTFPKRVSAI